MKRILFLCTGNSCRSQMAEGWAKHIHGDRISSYSAGIETHGLNPNAVRVMAEVGVNIREQWSKNIADLQHIKFDAVFTVCGHAQEHCPVWLASDKVIHVGFDDPPKLAAQEPDEASGLKHYRRVRDEIRKFVENMQTHLDD